MKMKLNEHIVATVYPSQIEMSCGIMGHEAHIISKWFKEHDSYFILLYSLTKFSDHNQIYILYIYFWNKLKWDAYSRF